MLDKMHPVHRLLHHLMLTIKGVHPRILVLSPITQSGNGLGMHVLELREGPGGQGKHPVRPLAEGLPTALHRRLKVQLVGQVRRLGSKTLPKFPQDGPQVNPGVSLNQQSIVRTSHALQCIAELVMLLHFDALLTAGEPHELVQKGFPARIPIIA